MYWLPCACVIFMNSFYAIGMLCPNNYGVSSIYQYTTTELSFLRRSYLPLSKHIVETLTNLSLLINFKRTKRGKRGGRRTKQTYCNINNLISIETTIQNNNPENKRVSLAYLNARSCRNKADSIYDLIDDNSIDLCCITETWLKENGDETITSSMCPPSYNHKSFPRPESRGGGIAFIFRDHFTVVSSKKFETKTCEMASISLQLGSKNILIVCVYRPPNKSTPSKFVIEFQNVILDLVMERIPFILVGDFNFDFNSKTNPTVKNIKSILHGHDLKQHVETATHQSQHHLDWVITALTNDVLNNVSVVDKCISDHFVIFLELNVCKTPKPKKLITRRNIKEINMLSFIEDLKKVALDSTTETTLQQIRDIFDHHAPETTRTVVDRKSAPWYNDDLKKGKQQRRQAERKWRKTNSQADKEIYLSYKIKVKKLTEVAKKVYYEKKFKDSKNSRDFFKISKELLGKETVPILPTNIEKENLPDAFGNFFKNKIHKIRDELENCCRDNHYSAFFGQPLSAFSEVTVEDVRKIVMSSPTKTCDLDSIPTDLFKSCINELMPLIVNIINASLKTGTVPDVLKAALVRPHLKKVSLDPNVLNNYRPVSNLSFISKILEKVVLKQILIHLEASGLQEVFQSAYRANHSTETALVRVVNDLLGTIDKGSITVLNLLDLSAAFDTIDHEVLLRRLEATYGISGTVLQWFQSYLSNRKQTIVIDKVRSKEFDLTYGVPQGSVLGPVLFVLYIGPLSKIFKSHNMSYHQYADDTQLYDTSAKVPNRDVQPLIKKSQACIVEVKEWMNRNKLKLNEEKTEVMIVGSKRNKGNLPASDLKMILSDKAIGLVEKVKNLGTILDSTLTMESQISSISRSLTIELKRISYIRPFITVEATKKLITALMFSKLDYCNSLLFGLSDHKIRRLQIIQNHAARLIFHKSKRESVQPLFKELHWLNVENRIKFKAAVLVFKCLHGSAPSYLSELLHFYTPPRVLRSSADFKRLTIPQTKSKTGERAFSYFGPLIWNSLPQFVRESKTLEIFKKNLKTHYFVKQFA